MCQYALSFSVSWYSIFLFVLLFGVNPVVGQDSDLEELKRSLQFAKMKGLTTHFNALTDLAIYYEKKDSLIAVSYITEARELIKEEEESARAAYLTQLESRVVYYLGNTEEAILPLYKSNRILELHRSTEWLTSGYYYLGSCYSYGEVFPDTALWYFKKAAAMESQGISNKFIGWSYEDIAYILTGFGENDSAAFYLKKAIDYNQTHHFNIGRVKKKLGDLYHDKGQLEEALSEYEEAAEYFISTKDTIGIYSINEVMITIDINNKLFDKARARSYQNIKLIEESGNLGYSGEMYSTHAGIFWNEGVTLDSAEVYYKKAIQHYENYHPANPDIRGVAYAQGHLGMVYLDKEEYQAAFKALTAALEKFNVLNIPDGHKFISLRLCEYYRRQGQFAAAERYGLQALSKTNEKDTLNLTNIYQTLGEVYEGKQDYPKALKYLKLHYEFLESLYLQRVSNENKEKLLLIENKNEALALSEKKNEILKREQRLNKRLLGGGIVLLLLLLGYIYRQRKEQKEKDRIIKKLETIQKGVQKAENSSHQAEKEQTEFSRKAISYLDKINQEITNLQRTNREAKLKEEELSEVVNELRSFNYMVAHDLKQPIHRLKKIAFWLQSSEQENLDSSAKEYLDFIQYSSEQMESLINSMLIFSEVEKQTVFISEFSGQELLEELKKDFSAEFKENNISFNIEQLPDLRSDRVLLKSVFQNLIDNAVKFVDPDKKSYIKVNSHNLSTEYRIIVEDNGIGFPGQKNEIIFKLFHQLNEDKEGSGAGLAISKKIMERLGGRIKAVGAEGEGAAFSVYLPKKN